MLSRCHAVMLSCCHAAKLPYPFTHTAACATEAFKLATRYGPGSASAHLCSAFGQPHLSLTLSSPPPSLPPSPVVVNLFRTTWFSMIQMESIHSLLRQRKRFYYVTLCPYSSVNCQPCQLCQLCQLCQPCQLCQHCQPC